MGLGLGLGLLDGASSNQRARGTVVAMEDGAVCRMVVIGEG